MVSHWSNETVCQFHHRPQGTVGASEIVCVLESESSHMHVWYYASVCECVWWGYIKLQRSRCACTCVCLRCRDVKLLPQRASQGERERRDVLGDGWEVDHAEWKLSVPQKNCYGITEHDSLTVSLSTKENSRTWGVAKNQIPCTSGL